MDATPTVLPEQGLSEPEAASRLARFGFNELPRNRRSEILGPILDTLREPMILLLVVSGIIYGLLGDHVEALLLGGSVLVVMAINLAGEYRSNRALRALKELASPRALVLRNGNPTRISARDVVPDDILILSEGDRVPADADVLSSSGLTIDESLVSGESAPVEKNSVERDSERSQLFSGTLVVRGSGIGRVTHTGSATEVGKIGSVLATTLVTKTPLQQQSAKLVRAAALAGVAFCLLVIGLYGITRGDWMQASLAGIALAMSLLPEEIPVILSVFLALGARRLAGKGMLVHYMPAVEGLGTLTVLCTDKTGTLTRNSMTLQAVVTDGTPAFLTSATPSISANDLHLLSIAQCATKFPAWDPMDRAVQEAAARYGILHTDGTLVQEIGLSPERPAMFNAYRTGTDGFIAVKGMPETIMSLSGLDATRAQNISKQIEAFAERGMRVLAVAESRTFERSLPIEDHQFSFLGLLAFQDPLREGVPAAVQECYEAGIRVVMITGDYPATAASIAREAGIRDAENVLTGKELVSLSPEEARQKIATTNVFARIKPIEKLQIVEALKQSGEIVGMTGDGINDAPALKAAHIGIAMGARGTDVAREAASVVLTQDDFPSLVRAIRQGRRTFDNIKKAMYYVLAMHVPIAGLSILPLLLGLPVIFYPIHIVMLELVIDPMSSIVFEAEAEEPNIMRRPPRDPKQPLFQGSSTVIALLQGVSMLVVVATVYLVSYGQTHSEFESRTLSFSTLVLANLMLALVDRSWARTFFGMLLKPRGAQQNKSLWWSTAGALLLLGATTAIPALRGIFHFGPFHLHDWILTLFAAAFSLTWFELLKLWMPRVLRI